MCKFYQITKNNFNSCLLYLPFIQKSYSKYFSQIQDDFSEYKNDVFSYIKSVVPYFWIVTDTENNYMGFIVLDNFVGNSEMLYSAEATTIYAPKAWGAFTCYSGRIFLKKIFAELGLYKICAKVYSDNFRVKTLLKSLGFFYESTLKSETLRKGIPQDIEVYSVYRNYYYKNEENIYGKLIKN